MNGARPIEGRASALTGAAYALGSFGLWGLFPLYFKAVS